MISPSVVSRTLNWPQVGLVLVIVALAAALVLLPLTWAALLVVGAAFVLALAVWPALGLMLLPLAVPFGSLVEVPVGGLRASVTELLLAATLAAWAARMLATRRLAFGRPALLLPLLGFVGAVALSLTQAVDLVPATKELLKWLEVVAVYLVVCGLVRTRRQAALLLGALLVAGTAQALLGIAMALERVGPPAFAILGGHLYRAFGTFGQPNPFGGYMNMVWPLAASFVLGSLLGVGGRRTGLWLPVVMSIVSLVVGLALVLSWSRGAWLGAAAAGIALVVAWLVAALLDCPDAAAGPGTRRRAAGAVLLAGILALLVALGGALDLVPQSVSGRLESVATLLGGFDPTAVELTDENFATVERVAHWWAAARMWTEHPWLGVGAGNYPVAYPAYRLPRWSDPLGHAHNYYLNVGAETGLLGFVAYLVFMLAAFAHAARVAVRRPDLLVRAVAIGALGVLAATAVHNLFDNLYVHDMAVQVGLVLGLVTVTDQIEGSGVPSLFGLFSGQATLTNPDGVSPGWPANLSSQ